MHIAVLHLRQAHFRVYEYAAFVWSPHTHQNLDSRISSEVTCCLFLQWSGLKERCNRQFMYKFIAPRFYD